MSTSLEDLKKKLQPLFGFLLLPLIAPEPKEITILDPEHPDFQANFLNNLEKEANNTEFPYDEVKRIFFSQIEDDKLNDIAIRLLDVIKDTHGMKTLNNLMVSFGGIKIEHPDSPHLLVQDGKIVGGSKNYVVLFLFCILYILYLIPASAFVIKSNLRSIGTPGSKNNRLVKIPAQLIDDKLSNKYNNALGVLKKAEEDAKIQGIVEKEILKKLKQSIDTGIDRFLNIEKTIVSVLRPIKDNSIMSAIKDKFKIAKIASTIMKIVSEKMTMKEKVDMFLSDVLDKNKLGIVTDLLDNLTGIVNRHFLTGLSIVKELNTAYTSPEFEVMRIATEHIFKVMKEDIIREYGEITTETVKKYLENNLFYHIGGKRRKRVKKTTKKRNKKGTRGKKSKNYRKK
jgi:hypothetical protein